MSPGAYIFQRPFLRGFIFGGAYLRGKNQASLIVGRKFPFFALFQFVFEGNFQVKAPRGTYIWRGDLTEGFLRYEFGRLYLEGFIHGGAYFRNFTVLICPYLSVLTLNGNNRVLWLVSHIFLLAEVSHDEAKMRERRETLFLSLLSLIFASS